MKAYGLTRKNLPGNFTAAEGIAAAACSESSLLASAKSVGASAFAGICVLAIGVQSQHGANRDRVEAFTNHRTEILAALHSDTLIAFVNNAAMQRDVTETKDSDSLQVLLKRAQNKIENYCDSVLRAWQAGIVVEHVEDVQGNVVPESRSSLIRRIGAAEQAKAPVTPQSIVKTALAVAVGDISTAAQGTDRETADRIATMLKATKIACGMLVAGTMHADDFDALVDTIGDCCKVDAAVAESTDDELPGADEAPTEAVRKAA